MCGCVCACVRVFVCASVFSAGGLAGAYARTRVDSSVWVFLIGVVGLLACMRLQTGKHESSMCFLHALTEWEQDRKESVFSACTDTKRIHSACVLYPPAYLQRGGSPTRPPCARSPTAAAKAAETRFATHCVRMEQREGRGVGSSGELVCDDLPIDFATIRVRQHMKRLVWLRQGIEGGRKFSGTHRSHDRWLW